jgi:hypothetical protein
MRAQELLSELSYPGNIGMMELMKFQKIATPEQKVRMKFLLSTDKKAAWNLLQHVTGVKLQEETLTEIDMSPSNLQKLAASIGALAGMEFEMVVPNVEDEEEGDMEPDFDSDDRVSSFSGIEDFFLGNGDVNGRREVDRLMEKIQDYYNEWASEKLSELWQDEKDDFFRNEMKDEFDFDEIKERAAEELGLDPDDDEVTARVSEVFDEFVEDEWDNQGRTYQRVYDSWMEDQDPPDESDFFSSQGWRWMQDIYNEYSRYIEWPYYRQTNDGGPSLETIGEQFSDMIGKPVNVSSRYHGAKRNPGEYSLETDSSIDTDGDGAGLEFITPPMPIDELLRDLSKTINWAKRNGATTNESTGLHMNVSIPNANFRDLDYTKLALLLGDNYVLDQFGRAANSYTKGALEKITGTMKYKPEEVQNLLNQMRLGLNKLAANSIVESYGKYTSINPKEGYVEFRSPGGDWLNEDIGKLTNTLLRFVVALDAALDPEKYRQEYLKKLYQLLQPKSEEDPLAIFAKYSAGALPKSALKSFIKQSQLIRNIKAGKPQAQGKNWWLVKQIDGAGSIEVVATNEQEAKARARASWGISIPDNRLDAKPVRAYDLDYQQNELTAPQAQQDIRQFEVFSVDQPNRRIGVFTSTQDNARTQFRQFLSGMDINSPAGLGYRELT